MSGTEVHLQPCPLSAYRIDRVQAWRLLLTYAAYQALLSALLLTLYLTQSGPAFLGRTQPQIFMTVAAGYALAAWLGLPWVLWRRPAYRLQAGAHLLLDVAALTAFLYACGGLGSGFGVLLAVSVAAAGLLIGGRCALGYAALATLAVLALEVFGHWRGNFPDSHHTYAASLGAAYFAIAGLAIALARRAEQSEALAERRRVDLDHLQQLNAFIVQHLQSGILVLDRRGRVRLFNDAALRLLGCSRPPRNDSELPPLLTAALKEWDTQDDTRDYRATVETEPEPLHVRASRLPMAEEKLTLVFLEDDRLHQQRVQESKLASLGRLTAGIAHEIRNPLGAIGHAAQLLEESDHIGDEDRRLVAIIRKHVRRVDETIDNVLQLSRRRPAQREPIPLDRWLTRFRHDFAEETGCDDLRLEVATAPVTALADPGHLKQILNNLCGNARKYGPPGAPIHLRLCLEDDQPCIEVIDGGPGIAPRHRTQIFEPFFTTSASGTGLGLYIARELAQLNQARLEYDNGPAGSRFRLFLRNAERTVLAL